MIAVYLWADNNIKLNCVKKTLHMLASKSEPANTASFITVVIISIELKTD